jgi:hypothetical protein
MAEILGLGLSHFGGFMFPDEAMAARVAAQLADGSLPPALDRPDKWPAPMRDEWGGDAGAACAARHRAAYFDGLDRVRTALEAFDPDAVIIFGDDQYECFREDLVPPYCVFAGDRFALRPFARARAVGGESGNIWGEPADTEIAIRGAPDVARAVLNALSESGFDPAYSLRLPHQDFLGHAFANTLTYLDHRRTGWRWPVVPFAINAYGAALIRAKGGLDATPETLGGEPDPPGPTPARCFDMGAAIAPRLAESRWRVALVATASFSHAFLTAKNHYLYPDMESDRARHAELAAGAYLAWRDIPLAAFEEAGEHELLNWCPLLGAMDALGRPPPAFCALYESWLMNSNKVVAVIPPV